MLFGAMMMMAASAQTVANGFKQDSIIVKTELGDYSMKTVYEYNADGQCTLSYGYAYQGGAFVLDGKTEIMFDEQGRMTKSESFTNVGGEYTLTSYTEYSDFNAEGLPTVEIDYQLDDQNPAAGIQPYQKRVIDQFYGTQPAHEIVYQNLAGTWSQFQEITTEYSNDVPVKITIETGVMGMSMTVVTELEYDDHNMPVKSTQTNSLMPSENVITTYVNTYNADGLPTNIVTTTTAMGMAAVIDTDYYWSATTGIAPIISSKQDNGKYYDLNGRRIANPAHGLYIHNGRKVIVK
jgi:hypothetical protein